MPLASALARGGREGGAGAIHGFDRFAMRGQVQGKAAGRGEAVERLAAAGIAGGGAVVLALVEEDAGLLAVQQVGRQAQAIHFDGNAIGNLAGERRRSRAAVLLGAHRNVVARDDALGLEDLFEAGGDFGLGGVHPLVQGLHDEVVAVAIDHQGGEQVGFAVDHAVGVGIADHGLRCCFGGAQAAAKRNRGRSLRPAARAYASEIWEVEL